MFRTERQRAKMSWRRGARGALLVLSLILSAFMMAVAIGTPGQSWLAWLTLPPLLLAIRHLSPHGAMVCGGLWGSSLYLCSVVLVETPIPPTALSLALLTTIPATYAFLGSLLTRGIGFSALFLALGWVGVEFALRPLALHNGLLAGSQGDGTVFRVVGGLFGYGLVAFVIAFVNGLLLSVLSDLRFGIVWHCELIGSQQRPSRVHLTLTSPYYLFGHIRSARPRAPPNRY